jgi:phosphatidate cytidylyltransferase
MLKLRILSAMVLIPLLLWATFAWPLAWFAGFLAFFILIGAWEWTALAGLRSPGARFGYVAGLAAAGVLMYPGWSSWSRPLLAVTVCFWLWAFIETMVYREVRAGFLASFPGKLLSGFFLLLPTWIATLELRQQPQGEWLALFLFVLVWGADTGAYFAGHRYGRHKLAPHVSPGKTWEGVAGGLATVLVLAIAAGVYGWRWHGRELVVWVLLALGTASVSVFGDLFESRAKRAAGVKDSGTFIPGHGGVLDRIDAYTAASPFFVFVWFVWQPAAGLT